MLAENLTYLITFVITAGIAVIGVLAAFGLYRDYKRPVLQLLLYQQIFLFSFFIYGIWGDIAIHEIISDLNINNELANKLSLFIPVLGTPFLIVSWFMLIRFGFNLKGYIIPKKIVVAYFVLFSLILLTFAILIQNETVVLPLNPEQFIVRVLVIANFCFHAISMFSLLKPTNQLALLIDKKLINRTFTGYLAGVVLYSLALFYFDYFGFVYTCFSILLLFGISAALPASLRFSIKPVSQNSTSGNSDFVKFCEQYEISKREAEIILEICSGKTNRAISEKLFITLQTVKDHNHRIFTKTQVKSRVQLTNLVREKTGKTNL